MQFRVGARRRRSTPRPHPSSSSCRPSPRCRRRRSTRPLALLEEMSAFFDDGPAEALLGTVAGDPNVAPGVWTKRLWMDPVTENPARRRHRGVGALQRHRRRPPDAHPRGGLRGGQPPGHRRRRGRRDRAGRAGIGRRPRRSRGRPGVKDTVIAYPGQVTRVRAQFDTPGQFVWHCHIVEHEDNEMMRPYRIGPVQPGQPA